MVLLFMKASQVRNCVSINGFACRCFAPWNRTVVAADILWRSILLDQLLHDSPYALCMDKTIDMDDRTLTRICLRFARVSSLSAPRYTEDVQHFETATTERLIVDKISALNMARMFGLRKQPGADPSSPTPWFAWGDRQT